MREKTKVRVFKNGVEVGWFKDIVPGANALINSCRVHGFDIEQYDFRDYDTAKNILWKGEKSMLESQRDV